MRRSAVNLQETLSARERTGALAAVAGTLPPVAFFLPDGEWPADLKDRDGYFWSPDRAGRVNWIVQTWDQLRALGFPCRMARTLPEDGIVIAHRRVLPRTLRPAPRQLLVCVQADYTPHPFAQLHILQNRSQVALASSSLGSRWDAHLLGQADVNHFVQTWPQPELVPRDPDRGDAFRRVAFVGRSKNLHPDLARRSWSAEMGRLGLEWRIVDRRGEWRDYREIDAIVALRQRSQTEYLHKPANKLVNAWRAGVPAVLGFERAFRDERRGPLDYLEVRTPDEVSGALSRLRDDPALRSAMVENGLRRALEYRAPLIAEQWTAFLQNVAAPAWQHWCALGIRRRALFLESRRVRLLFPPPAEQVGARKRKKLRPQ
jgi:hypothetical protein